MGWIGPLICYLYFLFGQIINYFLIKILSKHWYKQEIYEGDYRYSHGFIRSNIESIALYNSNKTELNIHNNLLNNIISNKWKIIKDSSFLYFNMNLFGFYF
jgi:ABC-type uncharacterized transport system fused permease/ATPase subunit